MSSNITIEDLVSRFEKVVQDKLDEHKKSFDSTYQMLSAQVQNAMENAAKTKQSVERLEKCNLSLEINLTDHGIILHGIPEQLNAVEFTKELIHQHVPNCAGLDNCYRLGKAEQPNSSKQRPILARFVSKLDRDSLLNLAIMKSKKKETFRFRDLDISIQREKPLTYRQIEHKHAEAIKRARQHKKTVQWKKIACSLMEP